MATARVVTTQVGSKTDSERPSRREFLSYMWGASTLLLLAGLVIALVWFMLPSSFTNPDWIIPINLDDLPSIGTPVSFPDGRFYLALTDDDSLIALYSDAPGLGCLVRWIPLNQRFEEPCYGYKFRLDGTYMEGMVHPHDLGRYVITITFADGSTEMTNDNGDPIPLAGREVLSVTVDTRRLIQGAPRQ